MKEGGKDKRKKEERKGRGRGNKERRENWERLSEWKIKKGGKLIRRIGRNTEEETEDGKGREEMGDEIERI